MATTTTEHSANNYVQFQQWVAKTPNLLCYTYYGCTLVGGYYERPIWYRMQNDLQTFASLGITGLAPAIYHDDDSLCDLAWIDWGFNSHNIWEMNMMSHWIYSKLAWNPYEDVDELVKYFCDKVYGAASEAMQEYYKYIKMGWEDGTETMASEFNVFHKWNTDPAWYFQYYLDIEVDGIYIYDAIKEALAKAYELADERAKGYLERPIWAFDDWEEYSSRERVHVDFYY
jgi:hypothetical protein